jgi:hypothetical protein
MICYSVRIRINRETKVTTPTWSTSWLGIVGDVLLNEKHQVIESNSIVVTRVCEIKQISKMNKNLTKIWSKWSIMNYKREDLIHTKVFYFQVIAMGFQGLQTCLIIIITTTTTENTKIWVRYTEKYYEFFQIWCDNVIEWLYDWMLWMNDLKQAPLKCECLQLDYKDSLPTPIRFLSRICWTIQKNKEQLSIDW